MILLALAYRPVLDPLPIQGWEWAVLPVITLLLSMAYKGVRNENIASYWRDTFKMAIGILVGLAILSAGSWLLIEVMAALAP